MEIICKNCRQIYKGHYCNNCGQPADTHKLNFHYLLHDIQHGFLHFDKGVIYTAKELFTRPGHTIREFIEGKRVRHFKPISLVIILATAYAAITHLLKIHMPITIEGNGDPNQHIDPKTISEWINTHFSLITLAFIPLHTIGTVICFRKQGYNFIEYFILNTYRAAQKLYVSILLIPLFYYYNGTPTFNKLFNIIFFIDLILTFWTNGQFFNKLSKIKTFILTIVSFIIFAILATITASILVTVFNIF